MKELLLNAVSRKFLYVVLAILAVAGMLLLLSLFGAGYIRKSVQKIRKAIAEEKYAEAREAIERLKKRAFGKNKSEMDYYLAYTCLAERNYGEFFEKIEEMRTYRGKVTKIYRTDCIYLLLIARLMMRDVAGAEKAYSAFCSALASETGYARKFGVYKEFFAACLEVIDEEKDGLLSGVSENKEVLHRFEKDGMGSILISRLAKELL